MMNFKCGVLSVVLTACFANAQYVGTLDRNIGTRSKAENNLFISWLLQSDDARAKQVEVFDMTGRSLAVLEVLRPVPEAGAVAIYDVSAQPGGVIAVAAVYGSKQAQSQVRPAAALLMFDFSGKLLSVFRLASSRQISRLEVDDQSRIWTLTDHASDGVAPSSVPMVVEYSASGTEEKQLLNRAMFPIEAKNFRQDVSLGPPSIGLDSGVLWFWLPGSTELVTISTNDGKHTKVKTGLPKTETQIVPYRVLRMDTGDLVGQFEQGKDKTSKWAYYKWSFSNGSWSKFAPALCDGDRLMGLNGNTQVYVHYRGETGKADICTYQLK